MKLLLLIPLILGMIPVYAQTDDIQELQETIQELQKTIQDLQDIIHEQLQVIIQLAASNEEINARLDAIQNPQIEQDVPEDMEYAAELDEWNDPKVIEQKKKIYDQRQELKPEFTRLVKEIGRDPNDYWADLPEPTLENSADLTEYEEELAWTKDYIKELKEVVEEDRQRGLEAEFERLRDKWLDEYVPSGSIQTHEPYEAFSFRTSDDNIDDVYHFVYDLMFIWIDPDDVRISAKLSNLDGTIIYDEVLNAEDAVQKWGSPTLTKSTPWPTIPYGAYVLEIKYEFDGADTDMGYIENTEKPVTGKFVDVFHHYDRNGDSQTWEEKIKHVKLLLEYAKSN